MKKEPLEIESKKITLPKWRTVIYALLFTLSIVIVFRVIPFVVGLIVIPVALFFLDRKALKDVDYCLLFTFVERFFHSRSKRLSVSVAFVFATVAISMCKFDTGFIHISFSPLLSCMMLGTIFCNICDFSAELMDRLDRWTAPIYILFFVLSGAELELTVFTEGIVMLIGVAYIIFRCLGKYFGSSISATISNAEPNVKKYLGITLFPQAGVALGMAMKAKEFGEIGSLVANITLFSVLIYELVGPFLTKISLQKAGEIDPEGKTSKRIKHHTRDEHHPHL